MKKRKDLPAKLSRREFLKAAGMAAGAALLAGCQEFAPLPTAPQTSPTHPAGKTPTEVGPNPPPAIAPVPTQAATTRVAITTADSYDLDLIRDQVRELVRLLGGLEDIIPPGGKVALKVNLTSGRNFVSPNHLPATETFVTHPAVVQALGELALAAGASKLYILEGLFHPDSYADWGYDEVSRELNADLIDLNDPAPYPDFITLPVGADYFVYPEFSLHPLLGEVDTFISIAKMKAHYSAGITLALKNLVGMVPVQLYRRNPEDWWRSALHGDDGPSRLPRVIVDLNRARPIHFALVDGIMTGQGGEVPRGSFAPVKPGLLFAGKNALATDVVGTALMGFDPLAEYPAVPFLHGHNHLNLAAQKGLGTNRLEEIEVLGATIDEVRFDFAPATRQSRNSHKNQRLM